MKYQLVNKWMFHNHNMFFVSSKAMANLGLGVMVPCKVVILLEPFSCIAMESVGEFTTDPNLDLDLDFDRDVRRIFALIQLWLNDFLLLNISM